MSEPTGTQYAGFWARLLALLADSAILFLVFAVVFAGAAMALGTDTLAPIVLALSVLGLLYWPVMHASGLQGTFGKAIVGLKVTRLDARRISILRSVWRELAKLFSGAVLMLGYVMAAFTPRKQALHDLMSATYVVHDGPSRIVPALAVAVAGFALPVVVGPMVVAADLISAVTRTAEGLMAEHVPGMQLPSRAPAPPFAKAAPIPEPKAAPKPEPVAAPKPEPQPVVAAAPAPAPALAPAPAPALAPAPVVPPPVAMAQPEKPKPAARKPGAAAKKPAVRVAKAAAPSAAPKRASGLKYNDLMTAVLYRDAEGVSELLKLGKWADKPDTRGVTPLMAAAALGDVRSAEALLRGGANASLALPAAEERANGEMLALLKRYTKR